MMSQRSVTSTNTKQQGSDTELTQPARVLVADDDHLIATGLASSLKSLGHTVHGPVSNGRLAVDHAREERPDLAVLDIRMPDMTGLEAAEILWKEMRVPTVIVSAYSDDEYLTRASEVGVFGYLLKPITAESLRVAISIAWGRAEQEGANVARIDQLEQNLRNRQVVEQAKWKLVERFGVPEPEAHARMQRAARNTRKPLVQIAEMIIEGADISSPSFEPGAPGESPEGAGGPTSR
ncbi:MAG: response regulator [Phycisphaerales bacterium]|nr:MAG: response regulator [Phycisphaerales bacterium]